VASQRLEIGGNVGLYFFALRKSNWCLFSCEWHNNDFNWFDLIVHQNRTLRRHSSPESSAVKDAMAADFSVFLHSMPAKTSASLLHSASSLMRFDTSLVACLAAPEGKSL
jgi:hypothetical protein